jgi:hypothetical protein
MLPHFFWQAVAVAKAQGRESNPFCSNIVLIFQKLTAEDGKRQDQIQKFIAKNEALLQRLGESDIPADAPYRINLALVAKYRIQVATSSNPKENKEKRKADAVSSDSLIRNIVKECAIAFTHSDSMEDLIREAEEEMERLKEYQEVRLWEASTSELADRCASRIEAANMNAD